MATTRRRNRNNTQPRQRGRLHYTADSTVQTNNTNLENKTRSDGRVRTAPSSELCHGTVAETAGGTTLPAPSPEGVRDIRLRYYLFLSSNHEHREPIIAKRGSGIDSRSIIRAYIDKRTSRIDNRQTNIENGESRDRQSKCHRLSTLYVACMHGRIYARMHRCMRHALTPLVARDPPKLSKHARSRSEKSDTSILQ